MDNVLASCARLMSQSFVLWTGANFSTSRSSQNGQENGPIVAKFRIGPPCALGRRGLCYRQSLVAKGIALEKKKRYRNRPSGVKSAVTATMVGGAAGATVSQENEPLMKLGQGQDQFLHRLPSGLRMEVIEQKGQAGAKEGGREDGQTSPGKPPLLFVHGSYHAAWCWACWWLPYFAARGYDCYAISLLGQGASDVPAEKTSFSLQSHAGDIAHFIQHHLAAPPVLIGHSFGGLIVQLFLSRAPSTANVPPNGTSGIEESLPSIAAAALVCAAPPTGNGPMVKRFWKRDKIAFIQITLSFAAKLFGRSLSICRKSFFSPNMPDEDVRKYQNLLKQSSRYPMLDLKRFNKSLPLPRPPPTQVPPVLVLGAEGDFIVDREGAQETAEWYGTTPQIISGIAHDVMLDTAWERAAEALHSWLNKLVL